jgi:FkbM family methyltransferase
MFFIKHSKLFKKRIKFIFVLPYNRNDIIKLLFSSITYNLYQLLSKTVRVLLGVNLYKKLFPYSAIIDFLRLFNIRLAILKFDNLKFLIRTWVHDDEGAIFLHGEEDFLPMVKLDADSVVVDVGAYIGGYSIRFCNEVEKVIAIEPLYDNFIVLKYNSYLNRARNLTLINKGLFSKDGEMYIYYNPSGMSGATLNKNFIKADYIRKSINVTTLDELVRTLGLTRIDFLKIDVEGSEYEVLQGSKNALKITKMVLIETFPNNEKKCLDLLKKYGFIIKDLGKRHGFTRYFIAKKSALK